MENRIRAEANRMGCAFTAGHFLTIESFPENCSGGKEKLLRFLPLHMVPLVKGVAGISEEMRAPPQT
jgi:hypothetical protein